MFRKATLFSSLSLSLSLRYLREAVVCLERDDTALSSSDVQDLLRYGSTDPLG